MAVMNRAGMIHPNWKNELYKYISGIVRNKGRKMLAINRMPDHIHIFIDYKPKILIPDLIKDIKIASGLWINQNGYANPKFKWQEGYGAFSYSRSQIKDVCLYIEHQELHHKTKSLREEYLALLKAFGCDINEKYLFSFQ